ncbi:hypothetical protein [Alistipes dispar]|uniref:hypothetical protein n=1 Tax=Alistipes dispar TaxID=2585119 RepID=UPI002943483B|nr:hypothetical protein [Alistipes dispar]
MKKIMFNDRYGLTQAVIEGRKTMTRRLADPKQKYQSFKWWQPCLELGFGLYGLIEDDDWESIEPKYNLGEIMAVAQSYRDIGAECFETDASILRAPELHRMAGWANKMFVKSELMPRRIRITGIKGERLQDISNADCLKEGIRYFPEINKFYFEDIRREEGFYFDNPREAFAALIDKVSGRGTWASNPWVVVYEFDLLK